MIRMTIGNQVLEFEKVEDAIAYSKAMGVGVSAAAPTAPSSSPQTAEAPAAADGGYGQTLNVYGVDVSLWTALKKDVYRKALNILIEAGPKGMLVSELADKIGYNPKGVGGLLNAVRKTATEAGLDPDEVLKSDRFFTGGKEQSTLKTMLKK